MIAHRRGRVIIIDETARRQIRLVPRETRAAKPILPADPFPDAQPGGGIGV